jgi:hypothetical protein
MAGSRSCAHSRTRSAASGAPSSKCSSRTTA